MLFAYGPSLLFDLLRAEASKQHLEARAFVLRVVLEALPLKVLHQGRLAVVLAHLHERLRDREPELLQAPQPRPERRYGPSALAAVTQRVPRLREPLRPAPRVAHRLESGFVLPPLGCCHPKQP